MNWDSKRDFYSCIWYIVYTLVGIKILPAACRHTLQKKYFLKSCKYNIHSSVSSRKNLLLPVAYFRPIFFRKLKMIAFLFQDIILMYFLRGMILEIFYRLNDIKFWNHLYSYNGKKLTKVIYKLLCFIIPTTSFSHNRSNVSSFNFSSFL